ncbi:condensation domain-containing protein, partial [Nitrospirillum iridis]
MDDARPFLQPLSAAQLGIWLALEIAEDTANYNIAEYIEIHGPIDSGLFERALDQVISESQTLHLRFETGDGGLAQFIGPIPHRSLVKIDFSAAPDPRAAAESWMRSELSRPIELKRDPAFCYALLCLESDHYLWYQRYHHIIQDGYGAALIAQRLAGVYSALAEERRPEDSPFGSLGALLSADASYRVSDDFRRDQAYWTARFADRPEPVTLVEGPPAAACGIVRRTLHPPDSVLDELRSVARSAGATWPQVIIAAMAAYTHLFTASDNIILGLPVLARIGGAARRVPAMMSNVLPLRLHVRPDMTFRDLVKQAAGEARHVLRHQRYRSEALRRDLQWAGTQRRLYGPSVNIMAFDYELRFAGHPTTTHNLENGPIEDLSLFVYQRSETAGLRFEFKANAALYTDQDLTDHCARFLQVLSAMVSSPEAPVGRLDLLSPEERRQLLIDWNDTAHPVPPATVPALFEAQV